MFKGLMIIKMFITIICMFTVENTIIILHEYKARDRCAKEIQPPHPAAQAHVTIKCSCLLTVCIYEVNSVTPAKFKFSLIPNTSLKAFRDSAFVLTNEDFLALHNRLRQDKRPYCMGACIQVPSILNIPAWERYLGQYWDQQLVSLLTCGFPLDFSLPENSSSRLITNHSTAGAFAAHINHYIDTEKQLGAILGPFDSLPSDLHCSPMMTWPRSGSDK